MSSAKPTNDILWVICLKKQEETLSGSECPVCQHNTVAFYLRSPPSCASDGTGGFNTRVEESFSFDKATEKCRGHTEGFLLGNALIPARLNVDLQPPEYVGVLWWWNFRGLCVLVD